MKISTSWIQDFVKIRPPLERIADRLTMAGLEVKRIYSVSDPKDVLFEVEVTTNRPDWLSHMGVAREISAVENVALKIPEIAGPEARKPATGWKVQIKEAEGCPYYSGVLIEGIKNIETPEILKSRLQVCGIRSINLI